MSFLLVFSINIALISDWLPYINKLRPQLLVDIVFIEQEVLDFLQAFLLLFLMGRTSFS